MWFKLTNADFSSNNLGTMSSLSNSWSVSKTLGTGATYSGPTSVTKGGAFSATVTLGANYEIASSGVTFTMGGVAQSTYSTSGSTITFTISSVTGNIVIKVPTKERVTSSEAKNIFESDSTAIDLTNTSSTISSATGVDGKSVVSSYFISKKIDVSEYHGKWIDFTFITYATKNNAQSDYACGWIDEEQ